jgi:hypothetical protein
MESRVDSGRPRSHGAHGGGTERGAIAEKQRWRRSPGFQVSLRPAGWSARLPVLEDEAGGRAAGAGRCTTCSHVPSTRNERLPPPLQRGRAGEGVRTTDRRSGRRPEIGHPVTSAAWLGQDVGPRARPGHPVLGRGDPPVYPTPSGLIVTHIVRGRCERHRGAPDARTSRLVGRMAPERRACRHDHDHDHDHVPTGRGAIDARRHPASGHSVRPPDAGPRIRPATAAQAGSQGATRLAATMASRRDGDMRANTQ